MKTYREAGVDIDKKDIFLGKLLNEIKFRRKKFSPAIGIGHYTGLINFGEFYLALNTDGVGTKMIIADEIKKWDTVAIDAVAMNVNDTICVGAEPVAFVDYLVIRDYDEKRARDIGRGLNIAAKISNVSIIGGETAVMPDMVNYTDLSGTALGIVKKSDVITGKKIKKNDSIIALKSSGLHSNGFTLVRKLLGEKNVSYHEKLDKPLWKILLEPTRIYVRPVLKIVKNFPVHGLAHITGGGLRNLIRLSKHRFVIDNPLKPQRIFTFIQDLGGIEYKEMYQTFNMGMGFMIIVDEKYTENILELLKREKIESDVVGHVEEGSGVFIPEFNITYEKY